MAGEDQPENAAFVGRVVADPSNPPQTRLLTGWLGDAAEAGFRRLYADAELSQYVDLPADAILYSEPIRDCQPAGGIFVWVRAEALMRQGGSAAARAGRFLEGQVTRDFSASGNAGPQQPRAGGVWPCITALPLCSAEPTGFNGQCTHQPWPNPTQYVGCTILHCPTADLTHQPYICNIVMSAIPGCGRTL